MGTHLPSRRPEGPGSDWLLRVFLEPQEPHVWNDQFNEQMSHGPTDSQPRLILWDFLDISSSKSAHPEASSIDVAIIPALVSLKTQVACPCRTGIPWHSVFTVLAPAWIVIQKQFLKKKKTDCIYLLFIIIYLF